MLFFFLMIRRPPRSTLDRSSAASDVYKRQEQAAAVLHAAAVSGWSGPIFCCGTQAAHLPYMQRPLTAYRATYGEWPADGLHVHVSVSYTHLRAHETVLDIVCRLLLEKKNTISLNT